MPEKFINMTITMEFLLMGFPDDWMLQSLCATLFFLIYLAAVMGNLLVIIATIIDQHLQLSMFLFMKNVSLLDICFISDTVPKSIMNSLTNSHSISFLGCDMQAFLVVVSSGTEFALLRVMFYDCYAAICYPLHYKVIMHRGACVQMAMALWLNGCVYGTVHIAGTFSVSFCGSNIIHQFCDIPLLLTLACYEENILEDAFLIFSFCFAFVYFILMVVSYVHIFATVLRIPSVKGIQNLFSTFLPHLTTVMLFLFCGFPTYLAKNFKSSSLKLLISVLYMMLPPTLNPLIYSLRNKDMQTALVKVIAIKLAK